MRRAVSTPVSQEMRYFEAWLDANAEKSYTDPVLAYWQAFKGEVSWQIPGISMKIGETVRRVPQWERLIWELANYYQPRLRSGIWKQVFRGICRRNGEWTCDDATVALLSHLTSRRPMRIRVTPGTRRTEWCWLDGKAPRARRLAEAGIVLRDPSSKQLSLPLEF